MSNNEDQDSPTNNDAIEPVELEQEEVVEEVAEEETTAELDQELEQVPEERQPAPTWVRELRKKNKEDARKIRELEEKLQALADSKRGPEVEKEPTLESVDFDEQLFKQRMVAWVKQQDAAETKKRQAAEEAKRQQDEWAAKLAAYEKKKSGLNDPNYEEYELDVQETLNLTQQGIIVQGAKDPAAVVVALGKNPEKARELAKIKDPVTFAFAVAELELSMRSQNKKPLPPPEKTVRGVSASTTDSKLERLRKEAEKTGDYSQVHAYRRSLKQ